MNVFTLLRAEVKGSEALIKVLGTYKKRGDAMYDADWDIKAFKNNGNVINQTQERSGNTLTLGYEFENGLKVEYRIIENEYHEDF